MRGMLLAETAVFLELEPFRLGLLVFRGCIIATLALSTGEGDDVPHD
jgi:hypothetical protein